MKIRKKIIWKNKAWKIRVRKRYKDKNQVAEIDNETRTISYLSGLNRQERIAALLHEYSHLVAPRLNHAVFNPLCEKLAQLIVDNNL